MSINQEPVPRWLARRQRMLNVPIQLTRYFQPPPRVSLQPGISFGPVYQFLGYRFDDFPVAEKAGTELLSLPLYAELSDEQVHRVGRTLGQVVNSGITSN